MMFFYLLRLEMDHKGQIIYPKGLRMCDKKAKIEFLDLKYLLFSSRASLTMIFTVKSGDPPKAGKIWENRFFTMKISDKSTDPI